ncbi:leucyl/phenylalanyl-tRNA--protein transferase [Campylobacter sp. MIT 99-7217]|uniref:leucyl/phenylalanyl-tRNA--protein transferase n=1 Tax=Campylobacter sp. MIT 99-7217 TaxID=535091 RepID=UPI001157E840|nr:leucyl/phenylalanyl-tRNA--protein transferase [Campylobacter sp. MIT 99-7217]TQR29187.1 leucyl/phenylalanyl-tRNA--protein transferase [Campylobacter sp. MIT 99-7217]
MMLSSFYSKLEDAPKNSPVFLTSKLDDEEFLLKAYRFGLFPWTNNPVSWWCPDPRMVLFPNEIYKQKSIRRFFKHYRVALDKNFHELIRLCANTREKSWLDEDFICIFTKLFDRGFAHSLEIYENESLVGGIYGLIIGKVFFGESMVSLKKNVSKIAMIKLCELLGEFDFIIDCQVYNPHLEFMGAKPLSRKSFLELLEQKVSQDSGFKEFKDLESSFLS